MKRLLPFLALAVAGCTDRVDRAPRLQSFAVSLQDPSAAGTPEAPLPFGVLQTREFVLDVLAKGSGGQDFTDYNGTIRVTVSPGEVVAVQPTQPSLASGSLTGLRVTVRKAFGPSAIWVEDASGLAPFALGTSPTLYFQNPRIRDVQEPTSTRDTSPLSGSIVSIDRGNNVVVHVANNGFYVVDRDEPAFAFASVFAFNFNRPEGLFRGDKLLRFGGNVSEFLGLTEIGFPSWQVDHRCPLPEDAERTCDEGEFCVEGACLGQECGDRFCSEGSVCKEGACVPNPNIPDPITDPPLLVTAEMEKYEGGLVRFTNVITSQDYVNCDSPTETPGANGNGVCEFCRTCSDNRNLNGICPAGGRCCPFGQLCNIAKGECTTACNAARQQDGSCETGKSCCPEGNTCDLDQGMCDGCTIAQKVEAECDDNCSRRSPANGGRICTNLCDFRGFGQYRVGLTTGGQWNGASLVMVTSDTVPNFRADAPENRGKLLDSVTGVLRQVYAPGPIFILEARDECDLVGIERTRTDCATVK